jgi:hypothetical protein
MKRVRALLSMAAASGLLLTLQHRAEAFSFFQYGGQVVVWPGAEAVRWLSPSTFPPNSDIDLLFRGAMGLWNIVPLCDFQYAYARSPQDFPIDNFDGFSDTAAVAAEDLDPGTLGLTFLVNSGPQWYDADMVFPDFPENTGWSLEPAPDCTIVANPKPTNGFSFVLVAAHELGHALGLGHDPIGNEGPGTPWFVATMNPRYPAGGPLGDQNIVELHADDRAGARFLYPHSGPSGPHYVDVALANFGSSTTLGQSLPLAVTPTSVNPGATLTLRSVIENLGTTNEFFIPQGFYLSSDATITTADALLGSLTWDLAFEDAIEFTVDVTLAPDLAAGTYRLGSILDDLNEIDEEYEDNNTHLYCSPLTVRRLTPVINPVGAAVATCGVPFSSVKPGVTHPINMAPLTWSLVSAPPGVTIHPSTGVVSWADPVAATFQYSVIFKATNSAGSQTATLLLGVEKSPPAIRPIANANVACGAAYTGPVPQLNDADCQTPIINWSLDSGPPGMTINFANGQVSWPAAQPRATPWTITVRATNTMGNGTRSWTLTVPALAGDINIDGEISLEDLLLVLGGFGTCQGQPGYDADVDINSSGCVDLDDLLTILGQFGQSCL